MGMNGTLAEIAMSLLLFCCTLPAAASDYTLESPETQTRTRRVISRTDELL
ncbi:MAG: hypothetical protein U9N46_05465 [Euryarchaeota archaeon]|nr:hypothetical protein [Euryarchaeota archaeon]